MKTTEPADRRLMDQILVDEAVQVSLTKFVLPIKKAQRLRRVLAFEGVFAAELFPGYAGVVRALHDSGTARVTSAGSQPKQSRAPCRRRSSHRGCGKSSSRALKHSYSVG